MKIGELSKRTNISIDTIRYYAKEGLLKYSMEENYWDFDEEQIEILDLVLILKNLNFSIKDIYYVLHSSEGLLDGNKVNKEKVIEYKKFFENKMEDINKQELNIIKAKERINKIINKLDYLKEQEEFQI